MSDFIKKNRVLIAMYIIFIMLSILDIISSYLALSTGLATESNPVIRNFMETYPTYSPLFFFLYQFAIFFGCMTFIAFSFWAARKISRIDEDRFLEAENWLKNIAYVAMTLRIGWDFLIAVINNFEIFFTLS